MATVIPERVERVAAEPAPADAPKKRIRVSNPYEQKGWLKKLFFHKKIFGGAIDHAVIKGIGEYYVRILRREPDRLFRWIEIETINQCNSTCSFCPVNKKDDPRERAYMTDALFTKLEKRVAEWNKALDQRPKP